jgi:hypothetical protein
MMLHFSTRWPMRQTSPTSFEVVVAIGDGIPVLNHEFVEHYQISDVEQDRVLHDVLHSLAIRKD